MIELKPIKFKTILLHAIFWMAAWLFYIYYFSYNSTDWDYILWFTGALVPVTMIVTYLMVYHIIPNYLFKKSYFKFALYCFYTALFAAHSIVINIYACMIIILDFDISNMPPMSKNFSFVFILVYLIVGMVSFVKILKHNFETISKNKELQNKVLESQIQSKDQELLYLKKQIHPHFLFNTLNTIYGFALKQSKHTPDIILKLSNLLDYLLYQVNKPKVSLKEEIMHIQEYIELEKMRFQDSLRVNFNSSEINENTMIPPMLLIPFVENAFKHGTILDGFLQVDITVAVRENQLHFVVKNTFLASDEGKENNTGIGLSNVHKRLDLHFGGNYELNIHKTSKLFTSALSIFNIDPIENG